jgi:hypothetical protein
MQFKVHNDRHLYRPQAHHSSIDATTMELAVNFSAKICLMKQSCSSSYTTLAETESKRHFLWPRQHTWSWWTRDSYFNLSYTRKKLRYKIKHVPGRFTNWQSLGRDHLGHARGRCYWPTNCEPSGCDKLEPRTTIPAVSTASTGNIYAV